MNAAPVDRDGTPRGSDVDAGRRPARGTSATGRILPWSGGSLWIGRGRGRTDWHAHHAHQIAFALEGSFRFRSGDDGPWTTYVAALVPSNRPHQFELDGIAVAHLFVEPETHDGRALSRRFAGGDVAALPGDVAADAVRALLDASSADADAPTMVRIARDCVASLSGTRAAAPAVDVDPRIETAIAHLRERVLGQPTLAEIASSVALSPSRFRHLFVQQTGTSFRAYLLWLRINLAIDAAMRGASWTEAAHEAGFADSAHLSRTHKRMFGIEPTAIRRE